MNLLRILLLAVGICGLGLRVQVVRADQPVAPVSKGTADVKTGADGILRGRVLDPSAELSSETAGKVWQVKLLRDQQVIVVLPTGRGGKFAVRGLAGGVYRAVAEEPNGNGALGSAGRFFRVWTRSAAPPQAVSEMVVPLPSPIVRGQHFSPLPAASLPEGLLLAKFAVGATAAPIVYYRARAENKPKIGSGAAVAPASLADDEIVAEAMAAPAIYETTAADEKAPRSP